MANTVLWWSWNQLAARPAALPAIEKITPESREQRAIRARSPFNHCAEALRSDSEALSFSRFCPNKTPARTRPRRRRDKNRSRLGDQRAAGPHHGLDGVATQAQFDFLEVRSADTGSLKGKPGSGQGCCSGEGQKKRGAARAKRNVSAGTSENAPLALQLTLGQRRPGRMNA